MKNILLLLLLPLISFTQIFHPYHSVEKNNCGEKPIYTGKKIGQYRTGPDFTKYKRNLALYEKCISEFGVSNFQNLEDNYRAYFDTTSLENIEGIYEGFGDIRLAIVKNKYFYDAVILEDGLREDKSNIGYVKMRFEESATEDLYTSLYISRPRKYQKGDGSKAPAFLKGNLIEFTATFYPYSKQLLYKVYPKKSKKSIRKSADGKWKGNGSGLLISKNGYIVTNNHVIDNANEIEVEFRYNLEIRSFNAKVIQNDKTNDLAIIKIDDPEFNNLSKIPYNLKTRSVDVGTEVYALGYPMALTIMGKEVKFTDGKISSKTGFQGNITTYQSTTPIQPGNSGGPMFDYNGNLVGINQAIIKKEIAEDVSYTIKSSYILNLIDVLPENIKLPSSSELSGKSLTHQVKILSDYVVLIKVK